MAKTRVVYVGWIGGRFEDKAALEAIGVSVAGHNREAQCWDMCEVPEEAMPRLTKEWRPKYLFGLKKTVQIVEDRIVDEDIPF